VLTTIIIVIDVAVAFGLILLVLLHAGRGGGLSDMFGGGQLGGSMAGSTVVERNLDRITVIVAVVFAFTTILLGLRVAP
jgi:preprotein translocase subunit SecG